MAEANDPIVTSKETGGEAVEADFESSGLLGIGLGDASFNFGFFAIGFQAVVFDRKVAIGKGAIGGGSGDDVFLETVGQASNFVPEAGVFFRVEIGDSGLFDIFPAGLEEDDREEKCECFHSRTIFRLKGVAVNRWHSVRLAAKHALGIGVDLDGAGEGGLDGTELFDCFDDGIGGGVDFFTGREAGEGDAERRLGTLVAEAHRFLHVGGLLFAGHAG